MSDAQRPRALNFGCATMFLAIGALFGAGLLGGTRGMLVRESYLLLFLPLGALAIALWPPRAHLRRTTWLARALLSPLVAAASAWAIHHPVLHAEFCFICPSGDNPGAMAFPMVVAILVFASAYAARALSVYLARWSTSRIRRSSHVVAAVSAVAVLLSLVALARKENPTIRDWARSLPELGRLGPPRPGAAQWSAPNDANPFYEALVDDVRLRARSAQGPVEASLVAVPSPSNPGPLAYVGYPLSVRIDRSRGLIVLEGADAGERRTNVNGARRAVFTFAGVPHAIRPAELRARVPPPMAWKVVAVIALVAGLAVLGRAERPPTASSDPYRAAEGVPVESTGVREAFALAILSLGSAPLIVACLLGFAP